MRFLLAVGLLIVNFQAYSFGALGWEDSAYICIGKQCALVSPNAQSGRILYHYPSKEMAGKQNKVFEQLGMDDVFHASWKNQKTWDMIINKNEYHTVYFASPGEAIDSLIWQLESEDVREHSYECIAAGLGR